MKTTMKLHLRRAPVWAACLICMQAYAAGRVELVSGNVSVMSPQGQLRLPQRGDRIEQGESIVTGSDGELHLHMDDNALVAVRPRTTLKIDAYVAEATSRDQAIFRLLRGTFRSITGWIGKNDPQRYLVHTPTATIGIRGTDHEPAVVEDGEEAGTYDKVNEGGTLVESAGRKIEVAPGSAGFAPRSGAAPRVLAAVPQLYQGPKPNEAAVEEGKKELARTLPDRLKQKQQEAATRGPVSRTNQGVPGPDAVRAAIAAVEQIFRAIEIGDALLLRTRMDPSMIGYQRILDDVAQEANRCKQIRIHAPDMQVQVGNNIAVVQVPWEKRCLEMPDLKPRLASGHSTLLLHFSKGAWSLAAIPAQSMFSPISAPGFVPRPVVRPTTPPGATPAPTRTPPPNPTPGPTRTPLPTPTPGASPGPSPTPTPSPLVP
jgi:hypothetical protein